MGAPLNLVGEVFGTLSVVEKLGKQGTGVLWKCRCSCGKEVPVRTDHLRSGKRTSCGCQTQTGRPARHGKHGSRVYKIWETMKQRCSNVNHKSYADYGGRGITYDDRWELFDNFYSDMGDPPSDDHTLDRRDNDGPYCADNCRWATAEEQHSNRSDNVTLTLDGVTRIQADWVRITGISKKVIHQRRLAGWTDRQILTTPTRRSRGA